MPSNLWSLPQQPQAQQEALRNAEIQKKVDKYLTMRNCTCREYLVQRVKSLADGTYLTGYSWNAGGKWNDKNWSTELPTDAQIVAHIFATYLELKLQFISLPGRNSSSLFVVCPDSPDNVKTQLFIYQSTINPPHFDIYHFPEGSKVAERCPVEKGSENLFTALVLFIYLINKYHMGYLYGVNIVQFITILKS